MHNCLTILDAYLLLNRAGDIDAALSKDVLQERHPWLVNGLIALVTVADILSRSENFEPVKARCASRIWHPLGKLF